MLRQLQLPAAFLLLLLPSGILAEGGYNDQKYGGKYTAADFQDDTQNNTGTKENEHVQLILPVKDHTYDAGVKGHKTEEKWQPYPILKTIQKQLHEEIHIEKSEIKHSSEMANNTSKTEADSHSQHGAHSEPISSTTPAVIPRGEGYPSTTPNLEEKTTQKPEATKVQEEVKEVKIMAKTEDKHEEIANSQSKDEVVSNSQSKGEVVSNSQSKGEVVSNSESKGEVVSNSQSEGEVVSNSQSKGEVVSNSQSEGEVVSNSQSKGEVVSNSQSKEEAVKPSEDRIKSPIGSLIQILSGGTSDSKQQTSEEQSSTKSDEHHIQMIPLITADDPSHHIQVITSSSKENTTVHTSILPANPEKDQSIEHTSKSSNENKESNTDHVITNSPVDSVAGDDFKITLINSTKESSETDKNTSFQNDDTHTNSDSTTNQDISKMLPGLQQEINDYPQHDIQNHEENQSSHNHYKHIDTLSSIIGGAKVDQKHSSESKLSISNKQENEDITSTSTEMWHAFSLPTSSETSAMHKSYEVHEPSSTYAEVVIDTVPYLHPFNLPTEVLAEVVGKSVENVTESQSHTGSVGMSIKENCTGTDPDNKCVKGTINVSHTGLPVKSEIHHNDSVQAESSVITETTLHPEVHEVFHSTVVVKPCEDTTKSTCEDCNDKSQEKIKSNINVHSSETKEKDSMEALIKKLTHKETASQDENTPSVHSPSLHGDSQEIQKSAIGSILLEMEEANSDIKKVMEEYGGESFSYKIDPLDIVVFSNEQQEKQGKEIDFELLQEVQKKDLGDFQEKEDEQKKISFTDFSQEKLPVTNDNQTSESKETISSNNHSESESSPPPIVNIVTEISVQWSNNQTSETMQSDEGKTSGGVLFQTRKAISNLFSKPLHFVAKMFSQR